MKKPYLFFMIFGALFALTGAVGLFIEINLPAAESEFCSPRHLYIFNFFLVLGAALLLTGILFLISKKWAGSGYSAYSCFGAVLMSAFVMLDGVLLIDLCRGFGMVFPLVSVISFNLIFAVAIAYYVYQRIQLKQHRGMLIDFALLLIWLYPLYRLFLTIDSLYATRYSNFTIAALIVAVLVLGAVLMAVSSRLEGGYNFKTIVLSVLLSILTAMEINMISLSRYYSIKPAYIITVTVVLMLLFLLYAFERQKLAVKKGLILDIYLFIIAFYPFFYIFTAFIRWNAVA